jgi:hypothetical protein
MSWRAICTHKKEQRDGAREKLQSHTLATQRGATLRQWTRALHGGVMRAGVVQVW